MKKIAYRLFFALFLMSFSSGVNAQLIKFKYTPKNEKQEKEYEQFLKATDKLRQEEDSARIDEARANIMLRLDGDKLAPYKAKTAKAKAAHDKAKDHFIKRFPSYGVSAALVAFMLNEDFKYTTDELKSLVNLVKDNTDTTYTNEINRNLEKALRHSIGVDYTDFHAIGIFVDAGGKIHTY